jgi:hypothetical protein
LFLTWEEVVSGRLKVALALALVLAAVTLGGVLAYLLHRGLTTASLWATFLVLPLNVVITVAAIWAVVLAARPPHDPQDHNLPIRVKRDIKPNINKSGDIFQAQTGIAIAHTGIGDILFNGSEEADLPDDLA